MAVDPGLLGLLVVAFAGGAFGAAIGALPAFVLAGLVVVLGELAGLTARAAGTSLPVDVTAAIGFGPVLGPHVAFGGGAAALAYAVRRDRLPAGFADGFPYHPAKAVTEGLGSRPDVLAVGGLFGCLGAMVALGVRTLAVPVDPVALGVVLSAFAHRAVLGYSLLGAGPGDWLDMRPYERLRERAPGAFPDAGAGIGTGGPGVDTAGAGSGSGDARLAGGDASPVAAADGIRVEGRGLTVEPWLPYQYRWGHVLALGVVVGVLGGYVAYLTASPFLAFGISVVALAFLVAGVDAIPVTHHVTLPASTGVLALVPPSSGPLTPGAVAAAVPLWQALVVGATFGLVGAVLGELTQRVCYAHADTHLDPPAASIVLTSAAIGLLALAGLLPGAVWVPTPG